MGRPGRPKSGSTHDRPTLGRPDRTLRSMVGRPGRSTRSVKKWGMSELPIPVLKTRQNECTTHHVPQQCLRAACTVHYRCSDVVSRARVDAGPLSQHHLSQSTTMTSSNCLVDNALHKHLTMGVSACLRAPRMFENDHTWQPWHCGVHSMRTASTLRSHVLGVRGPLRISMVGMVGVHHAS